MEQLIERYRAIKQNSLKWEQENEVLNRELSMLLGQKASWDLCRESLLERIAAARARIIERIETGNMEPKKDEPEEDLPETETTPISTPQAAETQTEDKKDVKEEVPVQTQSDEYDESILPAIATVQPFTFPDYDQGEFSIKLKNSITIHLDAIRALTFYQKEPFLISSSEDGTIRVTNCAPPPPPAKKGKRPIHPNPINISSFRPGSPVFALHSYLKEDKQMLLTGDMDGHVAIWEMPSPTSTLFDIHGSVDHGITADFAVHKDIIWSISMVDNHAITASADGTSKYIDLSNGSSKDLPLKTKPLCVQKITDTLFAISEISGLIEFYDKDTFVNQIRLPSPGVCMTVSDNGNRLLIGCKDSNMRIVDTNTYQLIFETAAQQSVVSGIGVTNNDHYVVTCGADQQVRMWANGKFDLCYAENHHREKFGESSLAIACTPSDSEKVLIASAGAEGTIHIFGPTAPKTATKAKAKGRKKV